MDNPISDSRPLMFALGRRMKSGLLAHGAAIGVLQNTDTAFAVDYDAAKLADDIYETAKTAIGTANEALQNLDNGLYAFLSLGHDLLSKVIGRKPSQDWVDVGFPPGTTAIPTGRQARGELCDKMGKYLVKHPTYEVNTSQYVFTAAKAQMLYSLLETTEAAVPEAQAIADQKYTALGIAVATLHDRMRGTINELTQLLDPMDPLWRTFGLNKPGALTVPDVPTGLGLTAGGAGIVVAAWDFASGAAKFRVWIKIEGVDPDYRKVELIPMLTYTLQHLPSGKTASLQITAQNSAGESAPSEPVSIVVP